MIFSLALGFSSCGDGDDNGNGIGSKSDLIGKWQVTSYVFWDDENAVKTDSPEGVLVTFNSDGSGVNVYENEGEEVSEKFTWTLSGDKLTIVPEAEEGYDEGEDVEEKEPEPIEYKVEKLTSSALELFTIYIETDEEGVEYKYYERTILKR